MQYRAPLLFIVVVVAALQACQPPVAQQDAPLTSASSDPLRIHEPWIRQAPQGVRMTSAYLRIENPAAEAVTLSGVSIGGVGSTEMHSMRMQDGMMRMRRLERIEIGAGELKTFEPGGWHLMLLDLEQAWTPGQNIPATLHFADGQTQQLSFEVRALR